MVWDGNLVPTRASHIPGCCSEQQAYRPVPQSTSESVCCQNGQEAVVCGLGRTGLDPACLLLK